MGKINFNLDIITADDEYFVLHDVKDLKENDWRGKKLKTHIIADSYKRIGNDNKARKLIECGTFLSFKHFFIDNSMKLHSANFCKIRLCPLCAWRRSLKIFGQVSQIMDKAVETDCKFVFATFTLKNVPGDQLNDTIDQILYAYDKLFKRRKVAKVVLGSFRALEITRNTDVNSKSYNTFHPHLHCVFAVKNSYAEYQSEYYIKQSEWVDYWRDSLNVDYQPVVDVRMIKKETQNIKKAVAEVSKYSVKDADYILPDQKLQDDTIRILDEALSGRRLISFRGLFGKIKRQLKLDDAVDGDLINVDGNQEDELREDLDYVIQTYRWNVGCNQYCMLDDFNNFLRRD